MFERLRLQFITIASWLFSYLSFYSGNHQYCGPFKTEQEKLVRFSNSLQKIIVDWKTKKLIKGMKITLDSFRFECDLIW